MISVICSGVAGARLWNASRPTGIKLNVCKEKYRFPLRPLIKLQRLSVLKPTKETVKATRASKVEIEAAKALTPGK